MDASKKLLTCAHFHDSVVAFQLAHFPLLLITFLHGNLDFHCTASGETGSGQ